MNKKPVFCTMAVLLVLCLLFSACSWSISSTELKFSENDRSLPESNKPEDTALEEISGNKSASSKSSGETLREIAESPDETLRQSAENPGETSRQSAATAATTAAPTAAPTAATTAAPAPAQEKQEGKLMYIVTKKSSGSENDEFTSREYNGDVLRTVILRKYNYYCRTEYNEQGLRAFQYNIHDDLIGEYRYDEHNRIVYAMSGIGTDLTLRDNQDNYIYSAHVDGIAEFSYDDLGRPVSIIRKDRESLEYLSTQSFTYSPDGKHMDVITVTAKNKEYRESFDYDDNGRTVCETDMFGRIISYIYNAAGKTSEITKENGPGNLDYKITYEYDPDGYCISRTKKQAFSREADQYDTTYDTYIRDVSGKLLETKTQLVKYNNVVDWESHRIYEYDSLGNPTAEYGYYGSELRNEVRYNSHGELFMDITYYSGSVQEVTYYIYDYDDIDPYSLGLDVDNISN